MSFPLIFIDEMNGFYKSKVMIFLWIGLPALALLIHISIPTMEGMSLSFFTSILVSSIGGLLSAAMIAVNIINEKDARVYDLFLIRPIKRWYLLISKFLAVFICVSIASTIAISLGIFIDYIESPEILNLLLENVFESYIMTLSVIAISTAFGIFIGVVAPSIVVGVIIVIFGHNYVVYTPILVPFFFDWGDPVVLVLITGIIVTIALLLITIMVFNKKEF